jgi:hypothetical protein
MRGGLTEDEEEFNAHMDAMRKAMVGDHQP